jgi:polysaccharide deacetylase family protein (PEP-CTERM system associated)
VLNALTIDLEDWYQGLEISHACWDGYEDRVVLATHRLLELLLQVKVRATFFVLGHVAERHPDLIREVASAGHEVATHGHSHTLVYQQDPGQFRTELIRCVEKLEELSGTRVLGHRAPFFSITKDSLWAIDIVADLGLRYDSSIFPVTNYRYGISDAPRWPHKIRRGNREIIEFPISTWRLMGRNIPVAGGAYFRIYPYRFTRTGLRAINREGQPAVFYLHPWELDPDHPRIRLPRRIALTHYFNLGATEGRLARLLRDFRFAPIREVLDVTD